MIDLTSLGRLGFGGGALGNLYRAIGDDAAADTVRAAFDAGIRYYDTAPHYGFGLSEKRLGAIFANFDPDETLIVSTKVGRRLDPVSGKDLTQPRQGFVSPEPVESVFDYTYDAVMRSFEFSRQRLRRERIDILYAHDIGRFTHGDDHPARFREFMTGGYRAMRELRDGGVIGAIGLGVNECQVCEEVLAEADLDVVLLAGRYTLLEQDSLETFLPLATRRDVKIVLGGPYNSGILATGVRGRADVHYNYEPAPAAIVARVGAIEDVCAAHGVPLAAAALQFPLAHPQVVSVIPGMGSARHVARALELMAVSIPDDLWRDLKTQGLIRSDAPTPIDRRNTAQ